MTTEIQAATEAINGIAGGVFLVLLGMVLFSMLRRVRDYRIAGLPVPVLLRRGIVLFAALAVMGGETVLLRILGITFAPGSLERLIFIVQADIILLSALIYYAKTEMFDMDDEEKP